MKIVFESQFTNLLLLLNGLVLLVFFYYRKKEKNRAMKFGNYETLKKVAGKRFLQTDDLMLLTKFIGITALIIGISSPVLVQNENVSEADYAILLDASGSMFTSDIEPTRFEAAKTSASNFVDELPNKSQVGFIKYSGEIEKTVELTSSHARVRDSIENTDLGEAAGTAMGNAITAGVNNLRATKDSRRIILLTDGTNNRGISLENAAQEARNQNVSIYAIGIGEQGNESQEYGILRGRNVTKSESPNLNPEKLRMLANQTSGNVSIVSNRTQLNKAFINIEQRKVRTEFSTFFIILSAFLLVLEWMLKATDLEVLP